MKIKIILLWIIHWLRLYQILIKIKIFKNKKLQKWKLLKLNIVIIKFKKLMIYK